ncbi:hypothetical protein LAJ19_15440 (plasmid) [Deinococcus taeanensis]|uniref:hypothetical protein n=1 Tax=Deinococcus taeanensis TaxID=2737050 RepID=UPI001CDD05F3|nr:hypothetical protein [Deinococcus taeanensis]UBV44195.1 hypothetical protein LAJ19_15440 [Deinococcus taeanensis]
MNVHNLAADAKKTMHRTEQPAEISPRVIKTLVKEQAALSAALQRQSQDLTGLRQDLRDLSRHRGGFPWGLVLMAGGAYAAYRYIPAVQERVQGLMKRMNPGAEGNLTRAGDAARSAGQDLMQGQNPSDAMHRAGGEMRRAGEKTMDAVQDRAKDLKEDVADQGRRAKA